MRFAVVLLLSLFCVCAGCTGPCFYQHGKSLEDCKVDLQLCVDQMDIAAKQFKKDQGDGGLTESQFQREQYACQCMRDMGYMRIEPDLLPISLRHNVLKDGNARYGIAGQ